MESVSPGKSKTTNKTYQSNIADSCQIKTFYDSSFFQLLNCHMYKAHFEKGLIDELPFGITIWSDTLGFAGFCFLLRLGFGGRFLFLFGCCRLGRFFRASLLHNLRGFPILSYLKKKSLEKIHISHRILISTFMKQSQLDRYRATHICKNRKLSDKAI